MAAFAWKAGNRDNPAGMLALEPDRMKFEQRIGRKLVCLRQGVKECARFRVCKDVGQALAGKARGLLLEKRVEQCMTVFVGGGDHVLVTADRL